MKGWKGYRHHDLHNKLCEIALSDEFYDTEWIAGQALFCPYYVPLEGKLGADWGVIVNPESPRFGKLTFEHDDCQCPSKEMWNTDGMNKFDDGLYHSDTPNQEVDMWDINWKHECDLSCDDPCELKEMRPQ